MKSKTAAALFGSALCLGACATAGPRNPDDPYEGFNRKMFAFNNGVDKAVLEPVARGYRAVTNKPIRHGVRNFVNNLDEPVNFANQVLQAKIPTAAGTVGRFVINTTIGIAGLFDAASALGIKRQETDFGLTLARWGVDPGPYLVMPFLGSTDPRDLVGSGVDVALNPLNYAQFDGADTLRISRTVLGVISTREENIETIDNVRDTQLDPYTTLRRFYVRSRAQGQSKRILAPKNDEQVPDYELNF